MLMSSSLASSHNQTTSINLTNNNNQPFLPPNNQFTSSSWVAADNALTPTVLAQPETATARVSLSHILSLHIDHILTRRTSSQHHDDRLMTFFACQQHPHRQLGWTTTFAGEERSWNDGMTRKSEREAGLDSSIVSQKMQSVN